MGKFMLIKKKANAGGRFINGVVFDVRYQVTVLVSLHYIPIHTSGFQKPIYIALNLVETPCLKSNQINNIQSNYRNIYLKEHKTNLFL